MYDLPELDAATDRLWAAIMRRLRASGVEAPPRQRAPADLAGHWSDPSLLLSQSCGYPLLSLPDHVRVVATPCYRADGCEGAAYRSALVVRAGDPAQTLGDLRGRRCAINGWDSNSGMNLLRAAVAPWANAGRFFASVAVSGSHVASMGMVSAGVADLAAIDCVTLALVRRWRPALFAGLRILGWTPPAPGLPLISAADAPTVAAIQQALAEIEADPALRPVLEALLIDRFVVLPGDAYAAIGRLERDAVAGAYPVLC